MFKTCLIFALALLVCVACADDGTIVNTTAGPVEGETFDTKRGRGGRVWLGIPYADPPIKELRFAPTQAYSKTWTNPRATKFFGDICMQGSEVMPQNEDCLYLNVWSPPVTATAQNKTGFAVMVFIYGGSWTDGSSSIPLYTGKDVIGAGHDVVVVTMNYRLRAFGFLGSDTMASTTEGGSTGNFGLQDQRMALQWVKSNIANFGGDPNNVMLFGESAGAGSTSNHLIMPNSWGLFNKAAMESGPFMSWTAQTMDEQNAKFADAMTQVNCSTTATPADQMACLRALDAKTVDNIKANNPDLFTHWAPTIDGVEITDDPQKLAESGKFAPDVQVMLGTNLNEGTLFAGNVSKDINETSFEAYCTQVFGPTLGPQVFKQYPVSDYDAAAGCSAAWWDNIMVMSDDMMACPARRTARWLTAAGHDTYLYWFTREVEAVKIFDPSLGCFHGSELLFVWNNPDAVIPLTSDESTLAEQFGWYWTAFAQAGNPNPVNPNTTVDLPEWPLYDSKTDQNIQLDIPVKAISNLKKDNCDFWDTIYNTPNV